MGGERVCQNTQVRTDLLDVAVWQEVCTLLAHPERLAEEYRRRLQPETRAQRTSLATVEGQISKLRQGVARLIDSYAEGLIDKREFEPRITRLRQRIARVEEQRQALAEEATLHTELQLIIGRLEDFAAKVDNGLETADWMSQRDLIRALVKRVEVAQNEVNIVFRVDPYPGDPDPEKKSLQLCRGSKHRTLWRPTVGAMIHPIFQIAGAEKFPNQVEEPVIGNLLAQDIHQAVVIHPLEAFGDVDLEGPLGPHPVASQALQGRMTTAPGPEAVAMVRKDRLIHRLQDQSNALLNHFIPRRGDAQWTPFSWCFWDVRPSDRSRLVLLRAHQLNGGLNRLQTEAIQGLTIDAMRHVPGFALQAFIGHDIQGRVIQKAVQPSVHPCRVGPIFFV